MIYDGEFIDLEAMFADETEQEAPAPVVRRRGRPPKRDEGGNTKPAFTIELLEQNLEEHGISVGFDMIAKEMTVSGVVGEDVESLAANLPVLLYNEMQSKCSKCSISTVTAFLEVISSRNKVNPVWDCLAQYQWDGKDRIGELCQILGLPEGDTLSRILVKKWLWQTVSLLYNNPAEPFGADGCLVLVGPQGVGKTSVLRTLAMKPQFFKEGVSLDFRDKDTLIKALGGWIVELGEIESTFKSDIQKLKAFLTGSVDEIRRPYARAAVKSVRRTSFCGSCNSSDFLVDTSGNRRFWTVEVQKIDLDRLRGFDVVQLWKQVQSIAHNDRQGFRLTGEEQAALAQRNTVHERKLPGQSEIEDILNTPDCIAFRVQEVEMTTSEFKVLYESTLRPYSVQAIGKVLDKLGRPSKVRKIDGKAHRLRLLPRRVY